MMVEMTVEERGRSIAGDGKAEAPNHTERPYFWSFLIDHEAQTKWHD